MEKGSSIAAMADTNDPTAIGVPTQLRQRKNVSSAPFAGRVGGNQEFTVTSDDDKAEAILKKQPDAVRDGRMCTTDPELTICTGAYIDFLTIAGSEGLPQS